MEQLFVEVAVVLPVQQTFYYRVPPELGALVAVGKQVLVPFGRRRLTGYIVGMVEEFADGAGTAVRDVIQVSSDHSYFSLSHIAFLKWLSSYYLHPLGQVLQSALPWGLVSSSRRTAHISEVGLSLLANGRGSQKEARVLSLVQQTPGLTLQQIQRRLPGESTSSICRRLAEKGLLVWDDQLRAPAIKQRTLKVVRLQREATPALKAELSPQGKKVLSLLEHGPCFLKELRRQVKTIDYWVARLGKMGLVAVEDREVYRVPAGAAFKKDFRPPRLTACQQRAVAEITRAMQSRKFARFLLHGVTGSGKTEVYLTAAGQALEMGRQALVLVPEIALTSQMENLLRSRFQSKVAILHSGLGSGERRDEWLRVLRGEAEVVVGARSAVFAPLQKLGLIVVDEEHDGSYKQEKGFRYHARDAAVMRAKMADAVIVMGSATPALSSYYNALQGKFQLLRLPQRIDKRPLPHITILDMRQQHGNRLLARPLYEALGETLSQGKQALLLVNRRGYAPILLCRGCGHVLGCRNCEVSLTWHKRDGLVRCHLCGLHMEVPGSCPSCSLKGLKPLGFGTQQLEAEVKRLFPEARVARMDRDTTRSRKAYSQVLGDLYRGDIDIMVGTQMIAKGHDFPNIVLVGVVAADIALKWPDFRAAETTFQLMTQVAGRAGRGDTPGRVFVQTYNPGHYSIYFARSHDYAGFFEAELEYRRQLGYPPFRRLVLLHFRGNVEDKTRKQAERIAAYCRELKEMAPQKFAELEILGPVPAPVARVKGKYRYQLLIKAKSVSVLSQFTHKVVSCGERTLRRSGVSLQVDVDPQSVV
ncbi:MAG: primosomal protein N' [Deltaproteobacteria bacterium]|nr:primosomal protein N' [Deltaproteobacteria bacterium]